MKNNGWKTLNVFEVFCGIGAQNKAMCKLNAKYGINKFTNVGTCDWYVSAIIAYALFHHKEQFLKKVENDQRNQCDLVNALRDYTLSIDSKHEYNKRNFWKKDKLQGLRLLVNALEVTNNYSNTREIRGDLLTYLKVDILTYSFPCQGLSIAVGKKNKGMLDKSSTSSEVWEIKRILDDTSKLPKYLLLENVPNMLSKTFINQYEEWKKYLTSKGYYTFTVVLDASNCGAIQKRKRVFAISILKDDVFKNDARFKEYVDFKCKNMKLNLQQCKEKFSSIFDFEIKDELDKYQFKDSKSNRKLCGLVQNPIKKIKKYTKNWTDDYSDCKDFLISTITTSNNRLFSNPGIIEYQNNKEGYLQWRSFSNRECFLLMGFDEKDYQSLLEYPKIFNKTHMYKLAGNSIVIDALVVIFDIIKEIDDEEIKNFKFKNKVK